MNQNLYVKNPRIIDLIIKYSGGLIKSPKQASILLIVISIVVIAISVVIVANTINEKNIDDKIQIELVMKALKELKEDYQDILVMRFVEDLSVRETAVAVGKSEGAVKLMQHRAIKELKKKLNN